MYRTSDPRFRRRINDLSATVETATESAQSGLYIFGDRYVRPCLYSVSSCFTQCVDASCPALNLNQKERLRRRRRGGAESLGFEFYDDWDDLDETDGLLGGWGEGNDEFDRLLSTSGGGGAGYGAVNQQPARQRGMSYPKARRKSTEPDPTLIPNSKGFFGRLFGGKALQYKPSAADLQEHPGAHRRRGMTEGEALLSESETSSGAAGQRQHRRARSGTATSGDTSSSLSSRGDIFPSDEEVEDAIPLDDSFAMVLERRNTLQGSGPGSGTESSSTKTGKERRAGTRPSAGSRTSTRRTFSSRSSPSSKKARSRGNSSMADRSGAQEDPPEEEVKEQEVSTMSELKSEEAAVAQQEEAEVERKRVEAQRVAADRGLHPPTRSGGEEAGDEMLHKETASPQASTPRAASGTGSAAEEPSQLPTPTPTDDEDDQDRRLSNRDTQAGMDHKPAV